MPMYQPFNYRRRKNNMKLDVNGGGQILDLETAVKDGVLDGGGDGGGGGGGGGFIFAVDKKLDLKKIIAELESTTIEVPSVFICPISLDPMVDPVTLCTGQTYERPNILKWFSLGRFTCPTTMQELWDDTVTPNTTLQQLIHGWFSQKHAAMRKRSDDVEGRALEILETLKKVKGQARVLALKELNRLVKSHFAVKKTISERGGAVVSVCSLLGPFTSHAVGSEVIGILVNLDLDSDSRTSLSQPAKVSLMVDMLNEGSIETKVNCTQLIETLMNTKDFDRENVSSLSLLVGLVRLVKDKRYPKGVLAGFSLLKTLCAIESTRDSIVSIGAIPQLIDLLPGLDNQCLELALCVLELVSTTQRGRLAMKDCANTIPVLVKPLMRVSERCTELGLSILSEICKIAPEECGLVAVEAGLAAKLLLIIQSGCDSALKQKASELLKLCSLNYTATNFISKCKLTRTIQ